MNHKLLNICFSWRIVVPKIGAFFIAAYVFLSNKSSEHMLATCAIVSCWMPVSKNDHAENLINFVLASFQSISFAAFVSMLSCAPSICKYNGWRTRSKSKSKNAKNFLNISIALHCAMKSVNNPTFLLMTLSSTSAGFYRETNNFERWILSRW